LELLGDKVKYVARRRDLCEKMIPYNTDWKIAKIQNRRAQTY